MERRLNPLAKHEKSQKQKLLAIVKEVLLQVLTNVLAGLVLDVLAKHFDL